MSSSSSNDGSGEIESTNQFSTSSVSGQGDEPGWRRPIAKRLLPVTLGLGVLMGAAYWLVSRGTLENSRSGPVVRILSYSSFVNAWGAGPLVSERFEAETGIRVEWHDAGDSGLLLRKLGLFPADLVLGLDQISIIEASRNYRWKTVLSSDSADFGNFVPEVGSFVDGVNEIQFLPFDWAPLAFIYRKGEILPPEILGDLVLPRFQRTIAIQDPRTSSPGLQFLLWVIDEMGEDQGFGFLEELKPNLRTTAGSWSASYGVFTKREAKLAFSYLTSPVYHWTEEKDPIYAPAIFPDGHPVQIEFAAMPASCANCEAAGRFARFLLEPRIQKIIMEKNYMLPVMWSVTEGTPYGKLPRAPVREIKRLEEFLKNKDELLRRWRELEL